MAASAAPDPGEVSECELAPSYREREAAVHTGALGRADSDAEPGPVGRGRGLCVSIEPQAAGGGPRAEQPGPRASAEALGSRQRPRGSWTTASQQSQGGVA